MKLNIQIKGHKCLEKIQIDSGKSLHKVHYITVRSFSSKIAGTAPGTIAVSGHL